MWLNIRRATGQSLALLLAAVAIGCGGTPAAPATPGPNLQNEIPFGFVDQPTAGAGVQRPVVMMYGWALDDKGVVEIRVYLDRRFVGRTTLTEARPDVTGSFPTYSQGNDRHGWALALNLGADVTAGNHDLVVQAVDTEAATRDIGSFTISVAP